MKLIVVSMVKNEATMIEAFCRHVAAFADHHLIFDHRSSDGTCFLLKKIQREGLPLTVLSDDCIEYRQAERTTKLMRKAVLQFQADWVMPLDADEFPQAESPAALRQVLKLKSESKLPLWMWLIDYAAHPRDQNNEVNPVLRMRHQTSVDKRSAGKVLVPARLAADLNLALTSGNHALHRHQQILADDRNHPLWLAHFPVYSPAQMIQKIVTHELQRLAGGVRSGGGTHLQAHYQRMMAFPSRYFHDTQIYLKGESEAPASYWGGALRYPQAHSEWERLANSLLVYVRELAKEHGRLRDLEESRNRPGWLSRLWSRLRGRTEEARSSFYEALGELPDSREATLLGGELELLSTHLQRDSLHVHVRLRNSGLCIWKQQSENVTGTVSLAVQLWHEHKGLLNRDYHRMPLPANVEPGDMVEMNLNCPLSGIPSSYYRLDLVSEGVAWFETVPCVVRPDSMQRKVA